MEDQDAIALAMIGDSRGPEALLARYQMSVYNVGLRILGNPADAEDAAQDVFLRAFSRLHQYRPGEPFGAWLHGIARNRCLDIIRARPRVPIQIEERAVSVESEVLGHLESERVRAAVAQLPARDRALLVLRYWEDQPVEAVARGLGMSEGAAKVALLRARRSLAKLLTMESANEL